MNGEKTVDFIICDFGNQEESKNGSTTDNGALPVQSFTETGRKHKIINLMCWHTSSYLL